MRCSSSTPALLRQNEPKAWEIIVQLEAKLNDKNIPRNMIGRRSALSRWSSTSRRCASTTRCSTGCAARCATTGRTSTRSSRSLLPLLEKLTTGKIAQLLAPNYSDLSDPRPIFDWMQIIRKRAVVYVGLDALSDAEVAAVGNSMFSDRSRSPATSTSSASTTAAGRRDRREGADQRHADEFNELMGDEFIPMVNKGGGAGCRSRPIRRP